MPSGSEFPAAAAATETGGVLALLTLATAVAALGYGRVADRLDSDRSMIVASLVGATGILLFVPALGLAGVIAAGLLMSAGTAVFVTANWAALTADMPADDAGRRMGIANIGTGGAAALAGLAGPLIDGSGFATALVLAATVSAAAILPLLRSSHIRTTEPAT